MRRMNKGERERPTWDESFMLSAIKAATRSSCLHLQTGAVIVRDKREIASGYNGAPPNVENCLRKGCRKDEYNVGFDDKGKGVCRGLHAEVNAMSQIARERLHGSSIYTLYYPCSACAKQIVGNGIIEVVYAQVYREQDSLTLELFKEAGVTLRHLEFDIERCLEMMRQVSRER